MKQERVEILIGGIGGQGVVYSANLIARAGLIRRKFASSIAHYGPESRGSVTTSEVVISDSPTGDLDYPVVEKPDVFIAMHQKAYESYEMKHKSPPPYLIYDSTLVNINPGLGIPSSQIITVPASQLAKDKLGNIMMANIILMAAFAGRTAVIARDDLEQALKEIVSANDFALNQKALEIGFAIK
ncbi:MAG: 2-oxoacid:acceptor oxidoreductase family protein [Planctomycetes bacterium]|nr:2-oxoacid:acceptor oxidoreductase family protein [Planctomycetota bacterium]